MSGICAPCNQPLVACGPCTPYGPEELHTEFLQNSIIQYTGDGGGTVPADSIQLVLQLGNAGASYTGPAVTIDSGSGSLHLKANNTLCIKSTPCYYGCGSFTYCSTSQECCAHGGGCNTGCDTGCDPCYNGGTGCYNPCGPPCNYNPCGPPCNYNPCDPCSSLDPVAAYYYANPNNYTPYNNQCGAYRQSSSGAYNPYTNPVKCNPYYAPDTQYNPCNRSSPGNVSCVNGENGQAVVCKECEPRCGDTATDAKSCSSQTAVASNPCGPTASPCTPLVLSAIFTGGIQGSTTVTLPATSGQASSGFFTTSHGVVGANSVLTLHYTYNQPNTIWSIYGGIVRLS